ncbi:hypothetical protein N7539_002268 [Penicillium diatomitis]|uniref:Uncharacterized protein n=1 Tax=Penicillium diatomitis TaxID=2819901 RepID=A0A9W9XEE8_9EURO|nr:uncharacterized protein N7539_002268 [Penicillium diatomitis]KAJ5490701.1 hypothetical protein N7539_002268 [Penicillium diatomitis]
MLLLTPLVLLVISVAGLQNPHRFQKPFQKPTVTRLSSDLGLDLASEATRLPAQLTKRLAEFLVDGTNFPQVPFEIGESYAGLLPNTPHGNASLFSWFFSSTNPLAKKEVKCLLRELHPRSTQMVIPLARLCPSI